MDLNIKLLILDTNKANAAVLAEELRHSITFISHDVSGSIQHALEAHLEDPFQICLITSSIPDEQAAMFLKDMQTLYAKSQDKLCVFIGVRTELAPDFNMNAYINQGYSTVISEKFDTNDRENLKKALADFTHFKQLNENIFDLDWSLKLMLAELDRVSSDRKRGRDTKFNTVAADFASDLVSFDEKVLSKYFDVLSEQAESRTAQKAQYVKIPKEVLKKNLPKLMEGKYSGASSRVWQMLLQKYGIQEAPEKNDESEK